MRHASLLARLCFLVSLSPVQLSAKQDPAEQLALLDSLLRANSYPLHWADGEPSGPGFELLLDASAGAQFVVVGEQHLTREIPAFTTAWFRALHSLHGFNYVALEEGPVVTKVLSVDPYRGTRAAVFDYVRRFPNSVHMLSEAEVEMFADLRAASDAVAPLWGVNQAYGAAHILDELVRLAPDSTAEHLTRVLLQEALEYEGERFAKNVPYLTDIADASDFERLGAAFAGHDEAQFLITTLALSHRISEPYALDADPRFGAFFRSGRLREENMKTLFSSRYREAQAAGDSLPRVLIKSGNVHARRGLAPGSRLHTFGSFLSEVARFNGRSSFFLSAHVYNDDSVYRIPGDSWFRPIAEAATEEGWTVFDLRPLQPWIRSSRLSGLALELRELLRGYDALLIIGGGERSAVDAFRTPNFNWFPGG